MSCIEHRCRQRSSLLRASMAPYYHQPRNAVVETFEEARSGICNLSCDLPNLPAVPLPAQVDVLVDETPIKLFMPLPNVSSVTVWTVIRWLPAESVRGAPLGLGRRSTGISKALRAELFIRGERVGRFGRMFTVTPGAGGGLRIRITRNLKTGSEIT